MFIDLFSAEFNKLYPIRVLVF